MTDPKTTPPEQWPKEQMVRFLAVELDIGVLDPVGGHIIIVEKMTPTGTRSLAFWPLTDANDRDMLVEAMREKGWRCGRENYQDADKEHWAGFRNLDNDVNGTIIALADTPGEAVCLAACKALLQVKDKE